MKGGKDEEKKITPLFPRVHVNDAVRRGGLRAPPRNRMALCETNPSFIPSFSSFHGARHAFTPFCNSSAPSDLAEKLNSASNNGTKSNSAAANQVDREHFPTITKSSSSRPYNFSSFMGFPLKKCGDPEFINLPAGNLPGVEERSETNGRGMPSWSPQLYTNSRNHAIKDTGVKRKNPCEPDVKESKSCQNPPQELNLMISDRENGSEESSFSFRPESVQRLETGIDQEGRNSSRETLRDGSHFRGCFEDRRVKSINGSVGGSETSSGLEQVRDSVERDGNFDSSRMNSGSAPRTVFPDDVVKAIGREQFWEFRAVMINQQRVYNMQVFELHKLITVQRLIANSPNSLLQDSPETKKTISPVLQPSPLAKRNLQPRNPTPKIELPDEDLIPKFSTPPKTKDLINKQSELVPTNEKSSPLRYLAHGNMLVPVVTPIEGLVYKPYPATCPQNPGFQPQICRSDSFKTGLGFPASHQPNQGVYPPYAMPLPDLSLKTPHNEQMISTLPQAQNTCSISSYVSQAMPCYTTIPVEHKDIDLNRSTARERPSVELPLFPTHPTLNKDDQPWPSKAVPHNLRSAPESAARILENIKDGSTTK